MTSILDSPPIETGTPPLLVQFTEDEFFEFCQLNRDLRMERTTQGELIIMAPAGGGAGRGY